jgi:hypothetical protein
VPDDGLKRVKLHFLEAWYLLCAAGCEPSSREYQPIAVGIDPGSKKEGFTIKSEAHTYLKYSSGRGDVGKRDG